MNEDVWALGDIARTVLTSGPLICAPVYSERPNGMNWEIVVRKLSFGSVTVCRGSCIALIDTGTPGIWGPTNEIARIHQVSEFSFFRFLREIFYPFQLMGAVYKDGDYYIDCDLALQLPVFSILIGTEVLFLLHDNYIMKERNDKGQIVCFSAFDSTDQDRWILGTSFLTEYYSIYDFSKPQICFSSSAYTN